MKRIVVSLVVMILVGIVLVKAQPLERFHVMERPLLVVAEDGSPCGPYFHESSKLELPPWFRIERSVGKMEEWSLKSSAWLVVDKEKTTPTWEHFGVRELDLDVFRMSETDARKSPCLRAVATSNVDKRWHTTDWISRLAQDEECDYRFTRPRGSKDRLEFLVFPNDVGVWENVDKRYIWVIPESDAKYGDVMFAEIFWFGTYRSADVPSIVLIHTSRKNYEKTKACLPPPD